MREDHQFEEERLRAQREAAQKQADAVRYAGALEAEAIWEAGALEADAIAAASRARIHAERQLAIFNALSEETRRNLVKLRDLCTSYWRKHASLVTDPEVRKQAELVVGALRLKGFWKRIFAIVESKHRMLLRYRLLQAKCSELAHERLAKERQEAWKLFLVLQQDVDVETYSDFLEMKFPFVVPRQRS